MEAEKVKVGATLAYQLPKASGLLKVTEVYLAKNNSTRVVGIDKETKKQVTVYPSKLSKPVKQ